MKSDMKSDNVNWKQELKRRALARMQELDAQPEPNESEIKQNNEILNKLIKDRKKYSAILGS